MSRMKVAHLITGLEAGGAETMLLKLATRMDPRRFEPLVVSLTGPGVVGPQLEAAGIRLVCLAMGPNIRGLTGLFRLAALLRRERPQLVQTWLYHADLLGLLAARLAGSPVVAWNIRCSLVEEADLPRPTQWVRKLLAWLSGGPRLVVANSYTGQADHQKLGYHPKEWVVIPNGFDPERFKPSPQARLALRAELGLAPEALLVGLVARYHSIKDQHTFLRAAALLQQKLPQTHFVLVGKGNTPDNPALAAQRQGLGLAGSVHLLGERRDTPALNAAFDIASLTSVSEAFSNAIGEAMACGVPCVVTDVGDSARVVADTGRVVPARNPAALAAAWEELLTRPEERLRLGRAARQRVMDHYSLAAVVEQYQELYERIGGK